MASYGYGGADDFILTIILVISAYDGVSKWKFIVGSSSFFIHDRGLKVLWRLFSDSIFLKYCLQSVSLKVDWIFSLCGSNAFSKYFHNFCRTQLGFGFWDFNNFRWFFSWFFCLVFVFINLFIFYLSVGLRKVFIYFILHVVYFFVDIFDFAIVMPLMMVSKIIICTLPLLYAIRQDHPSLC